MLNAVAAESKGHEHLADWLRAAERLWKKNGHGRIDLVHQFDHYGKLSAQLPVAKIRLVYSKAGTLPAAAVLRDDDAVVDHKLYWLSAKAGEADYLAAVLNSETVRSRIADLQSRGQWGARDFDKLMFELPIPLFRATDGLHREISEAGQKAAKAAGAVALPDNCHFVRARRTIREALVEDGIAARIEALVTKLLT